MSATISANNGFSPKVWNDHTLAYFRRKMALGSLALLDDTLKAKPGETVNFPFWKQIGDVQEPAETEGLEVDSLSDDAFSVTVKEVGKAVGWKDGAIRSSSVGPSSAEPMAEAQRQMARKFAEKVDKDIITEINLDSSKYQAGFVAAANTDVAKVQNILQGKINAFGDRQDEAVAIAMHSLCFADMMKDAGSNFLSALATDPMYGLPGFQGRLLGMALFTLDTMPQVTSVGGNKAYASFTFKANPFGIYMAQDLKPEMDRDILHRETIVAATMWYGVLALHAKIATDDYRIGRSIFATSVAG